MFQSLPGVYNIEARQPAVVKPLIVFCKMVLDNSYVIISCSMHCMIPGSVASCQSVDHVIKPSTVVLLSNVLAYDVVYLSKKRCIHRF